jgi:hypothetical protein
MHRGEHGVGNVRGPRNAEKLATPGDCHGLDSKPTRRTVAEFHALQRCRTAAPALSYRAAPSIGK